MTADDTTPQTSDDVIKRASDVMYEHANGGLYDPMGLARALDDAHLLADPADRDAENAPTGPTVLGLVIYEALNECQVGVHYHPQRIAEMAEYAAMKVASALLGEPSL